MTDLRVQPPAPPPVHPADEILIGYLSGTLATTESTDIERHISACDDCVRTLAMMQRRLAVAHKVEAPVPAAVAARALEALQATPREDVKRAPRSSWREGFKALVEKIREITTVVVRVPVLVPVAVAALALLVVVTQPTWMQRLPEREMSRSIERHETLRVTAAQALVRTQPDAQQPVIFALPRGASVTVVGEQGDWYRVQVQTRLSSNPPEPPPVEGWVERRAFE